MQFGGLGYQVHLMLNGSKTKQMFLAAQQMSAAHALTDVVPTITVKGEVLERTSSFKWLGTWLNEHLNGHITLES